MAEVTRYVVRFGGVGRRFVHLVATVVLFGACSLERAPLVGPPEPLDAGGLSDASVSDAELMAQDTGPADSGVVDAARTDGQIVDVGVGDGGTADAGVDAGPMCVPSFEECDAIDNDCDGEVDEDFACPCDRGQFNGRTYLFCGGAKSWQDARDDCQRFGYDLIEIESPEENDWASSGLDEDDTWWIGLRRINVTQYAWISGAVGWDLGPVGYTNFAPGEPSGFGQNCARVRGESGSWSMSRCGSTRPYVCEAVPAQ